MPKLDSDSTLLSELARDPHCRGSMSATDCRAQSLRYYTAADAAKSPPYKSLLTSMARTWVQLANQIDRLQLLQKSTARHRKAME